MPHHSPTPATLDDAELAKVKRLEGELGDDSVVVAYAKTLEPAELSAEQLARLGRWRRNLGCTGWRGGNQGSSESS